MLPGLRCGEVRENRENAAVRTVTLGDVELHQHVTNVGFDRSLAEMEPLGNAAVRQPLGHQLEHLAFALGQVSQRIIRPAASGDKARNDLRIERRPAARNAPGCGKEVVHLENAVLEEVAEAAVRDELDCMGRLDVLGEHEDAEVRSAQA